MGFLAGCGELLMALRATLSSKLAGGSKLRWPLCFFGAGTGFEGN